MGLAAPTGAASGATKRATSGKGITDNDYIETDEVNLTELVKIRNVMVRNSMLNIKFKEKLNRHLKEQQGRFNGTLLASLVA